MDDKRSDWHLNLWDAIKKLSDRVAALERRIKRLEEGNSPKKTWRKS